MKKYIVLISILLFTFAATVLAHPGNTDYLGGHYCWTNCTLYGYSYGEYHFHDSTDIYIPSVPTLPPCEKDFLTEEDKNVMTQLYSEWLWESEEQLRGCLRDAENEEVKCLDQSKSTSTYFNRFGLNGDSYLQSIKEDCTTERESDESFCHLLYDYEINHYLSCVGEAEVITSCPLNSKYDKLSGKCQCIDGFAVDGNRCISVQSYCQSKYGPFSIYQEGTDTCTCRVGFLWNDEGSECVTGNIYCQEKYSDPEAYFDKYTFECVYHNYAEPQVLGVSNDINNPLNLEIGWLVKSLKQVEVFYVDENLCFHWIIDEVAAEKHFGITWNYEGNIKEFENLATAGYEFCDRLE